MLNCFLMNSVFLLQNKLNYTNITRLNRRPLGKGAVKNQRNYLEWSFIKPCDCANGTVLFTKHPLTHDLSTGKFSMYEKCSHRSLLLRLQQKLHYINVKLVNKRPLGKGALKHQKISFSDYL